MANQRLPVLTTEYGDFASELSFCNTTLLALGRALTTLNVSGCGIKASHSYLKHKRDSPHQFVQYILICYQCIQLQCVQL
jgi:hypothetical protein